MRDLAFVAAMTILTIIIWTGIDVSRVQSENIIPKEVLELSIPLNGRIDVEFLRNLE